MSTASTKTSPTAAQTSTLSTAAAGGQFPVIKPSPIFAPPDVKPAPHIDLPKTSPAPGPAGGRRAPSPPRGRSL